MADTTSANSETTEKRPEHHEAGRGYRRRLQGRIVSDTTKPGRAKKTVTVEVQRRYRDPVYGKYIKSRKRYHAHDEKETFRTNDVVEIQESRPLSATKRWVVIRLVTRPEEV
jgi:small subunit ribosomal protein S17